MPIALYGQLLSNVNFGIGVSGGLRTPVGVFGAFYSQRITVKSTPLEFKLGLGLDESVVLNGGVGLRVLGNNSKIELFGCIDYSHHFSGDVRYDLGDVNGDYYLIDQYAYIQPSLLLRGIFNRSFVPQFRGGYSFLLSEVNFTHQYGPDISSDQVQKKIGEGLTVEVGIIVFLKP